MRTKSHLVVSAGCTISVFLSGMLAYTLPASLSAFTSSPQNDVVSTARETHQDHPHTEHTSHGVNTTQTDKETKKAQSDSGHYSSLTLRVETKIHDHPSYIQQNDKTQTNKEHSGSGQHASFVPYGRGQSPSHKHSRTTQPSGPHTVASPDTSPLSTDWIPHCKPIERAPRPPSKESHCPPSVELFEQLQGKIEFEFNSVDCSQELFILHVRVPEDYGFVVDFHNTILVGDYLDIYSVSVTSSLQKSCVLRKRVLGDFMDMCSLVLHTSNMQLVFRASSAGWKSSFNLVYKAHPRSSIPKFTFEWFHVEPKESICIYHCEGISNIPETISCDGVRHCEHGEDEKNCLYRDEGCGDWYPHNDQCLKATFVGEISLEATMPGKAEETCRVQHAATLAAFPGLAGQEIMAEMIRKSGYRTAAVGIRRVEPIFPGLQHLYRLLWQWGKQGSPIAYDQEHMQDEAWLEGCAMLDIYPSPRLRPIHCAYALEYTPPDGYICMRPNPLRYTKKLTLPGIALPVASSAPDAFPTKTCPDGSVVQTFHSCQEEGHIAGGLSPNNFPLFQCRYGPAVHFSLLCDGRDDCADGSDESDCRHPRFSPLSDSSFICTYYQLVPKERRCDGMRDCFDGSDEDSCGSCRGTILCYGMGCMPENYKFKDYCPVTDMQFTFPKPNLIFTDVELDGYGKAFLKPKFLHIPEYHYQCKEGFRIPTFLLNNGEQDCPKGEDEDIPVYNMTCPGYYRCQGSGSCVHKMYVCDGVHHCPNKDDELYCHLTCPHDSGCVCEGQAYKCSKMINPLDNLHVRYLDLSFATNVSLDDLHFMEYLVFLNLSFCRLVNVTVMDMPQLQTLDLSSNLLTRLSSLSLVTLPSVTYLDLSHNSLVKTLTADFTAMLHVGELQNLISFYLVNVSLEAIGSRVFSPLSKLKHLDLRSNQLRRYSKESLHGPVSLDDLYTDESKLCCRYFHPSVSRCHAPVDELSSCSDLLGKGIFRVCLWALAVLALVGNVGVLLYRLLLLRTRAKLSAASILVKNLCASDLLMGVYLSMIGVADAQVSGTYVSREREWRSSVMCTVAGVLSLVSSEVSALVVSLITLDRVLVLCFPFKPQLHFTPRATALSCLGVWVAGVVLAVVPVLSGLEFYGQTSICIPLPVTRQQFSGQYYAFNVFIVFNFIIFVLIGSGQLIIYRAVRKAGAAAGTARQSRDTTIARRLFLIVLTDFCCWFPVGVMGLLAARGTPIPGEANVWAAIFVLPLNSALNPFLYTLNALLERVRQQRTDRKMKKIVATLQNEITNLNVATVQQVIRICARTGVMEKGTLAKLLGIDLPAPTDKKDIANGTHAVGCHSDNEEFANTAIDSESKHLTQSTQKVGTAAQHEYDIQPASASRSASVKPYL